DGLQATAVALIGRSLGQKEPELAKAYGATCRRIGFAISLFLSALYFFGARIFMQMFFPTDPDFPENPQIVEYGVSILRLLIFIVIFQVSQVIYMGCLRGAGDTAYTAMASTVSVSIIRTAFAYLGAYILGFGIVGVWIGVLADQMSRFLFGWLRFRSGKWTKIKI
ncbi:MAG: multidrug transporter, partial [Lachnospiraceae bacterium]|nr:multidrug transporter [Lachnospiraceae bacterium]